MKIRTSNRLMIILLLTTLSFWLISFEWVIRSNTIVKTSIRFALIGAGISLIIWKYRGSKKVKLPLSAAILIGYCVYTWILTLQSPLPSHSIEIQVYQIIFIVAIILFTFGGEDAFIEKAWKFAFLQGAIIFSLINLTLVVIWFLNLSNLGIIGSWTELGYRLPGLFLLHPNNEVAYLALIIPFLLVEVLRTEKKLVKVTYTLLLFLMSAVAFFASSRGGWLAIFAGISITLLIYFSKQLMRIINRLMDRRAIKISPKLLVSICVVFGGIILLGYLSYQQARFTSHGGRTNLWRVAWAIILKSPLIGHGNGSFHVLSAVEGHNPPGFYIIHAHNFVLQVLAESGIVGLSILFASGYILLKDFYRALSNSEQGNYSRIASYAGSLSAVAAHALVDYPFEAPIYSIGVLFLITRIGLTPKNCRSLSVPSSLFAIGVFLLATLAPIWQLTLSKGSIDYQKGFQSLPTRDWAQLQTSICTAAANSPSNSLFQFQCGLSTTIQAEITSDPELLAEAAFKYRVGLELDPYWPIHRANLASLYWSMGNLDEAIQNMETAYAQASNFVPFNLGLGVMYFETGRIEESEHYFIKAYELNPWLLRGKLIDITDWQALSRLEILARLDTPVGKSTLNALEGWLLLDQGDIQEAEARFMSSLEYNPRQVEAFAGLAKTALLKGEIPTANDIIGLGKLINGNSSIINEVAGDIAFDLGDLSGAMENYSRSLISLIWGNSSSAYYGSVYRDSYLPMDTNPQAVQQSLPIHLISQVEKTIAMSDQDLSLDLLQAMMPWYSNRMDLIDDINRLEQ